MADTPDDQQTTDREADANSEKPSVLWWVKPYWKRWKHRRVASLRAISTNRAFALILPWVTGTYYAILDIWGDRWPLIKDHIEIHERVFWGCLGLSLLGLFVRGLVKPPEHLEGDDTARQVLADFITTVGAIVQAKIERFRGKLGALKKNSDKFAHITQPEDQLRVIANAAVGFLRDTYALAEDEIDITILRRKAGGKWHFQFVHQKWSHTDPDEAMGSKTAACHCLETGEEIFIADKLAAARAGLFRLTPRDKRRGSGSAFVYPLHFDTPSGAVEFVISFVTYGRQFCEDFETTAVSITRAFLREISRRFEIELCLHTIKTNNSP